MLNLLEYLDDFSRQIEIYEMHNRKLVVKNYRKETGILKWLLVNASNLTINIYPFAFQPSKRIEREVFFHRKGPQCFKKPALYVADFMSLRIIREFVEGVPFPKAESEENFFKLGVCLSKLHGEKWALGDSKISNFILSENSIYLIDSEQATCSEEIRHYAWDLIVLASTIVFFSLEHMVYGKKDLKKIIRAAIEGYSAGGGVEAKNILETLEKPSLKTITFILIPYPYNKMFLSIWREVSGK